MIPNKLIEALTVSLGRWDGRDPTSDDDYEAGKEMAAAITTLLVWNSPQS